MLRKTFLYIDRDVERCLMEFRQNIYIPRRLSDVERCSERFFKVIFEGVVLERNVESICMILRSVAATLPFVGRFFQGFL